MLTSRELGVRYAHDRPSLLSQGDVVGLEFPFGNVDERGWGSGRACESRSWCVVWCGETKAMSSLPGSSYLSGKWLHHQERH